MNTLQIKPATAKAAAVLALLLVGALPAAAQFPGGGGGGGGRGGGTTSGGLQAATRVSVVADEFSNSLIILAPEPYHEAISNLVRQLDVAQQDITEVRVFHLQNADPAEMAQVLTGLFPDPTTSNNGGRGQGTFFGGGRGGGRGGATTADSDRAKKQGKVLAVADARTSSVIVSASKDLMDQIAPMVAQLDASTSKKQQVYVHSLENADPQEVELILRNLFETQNARNGRTAQQNNQQNNALSQRSSNAARSQGTTTGTGTGTGLGGGGLGGGAGLGGTGR